MEILHNEWVIGIAGGILSGFIVTLITRYLFSKKDNKEYAQRVSVVNRELIYALRPGIYEENVPDINVLNSLINATSRKYRVERHDVFQVKQVSEELIKEIMDSSFISSEVKNSYCNNLAKFISESYLSNDSEGEIERKSIESDLRRRLTERMSIMLGLIAALLTMSATLTTIINKKIPLSINIAKSPVLDIVFPTVIILGTVLAATLVMFLKISLKKDRVKKIEEDGGNET